MKKNIKVSVIQQPPVYLNLKASIETEKIATENIISKVVDLVEKEAEKIEKNN